MELIRRLGSALRVTSLDSLLLGINVRSGKADHMINIGKMVTYNQQLARHALAALHIIRRVACAPSTQKQLLALYSNQPSFTTVIRHAFIEAMEMDESSLGGDQLAASVADADCAADVETNAAQACKLVVIHLLIEGVNLPHPSLAHYLLGFEIHAPLNK